MDALQSIMADARAIRTSFEFGVVSNDQMRNLSEKMRDIATSSATEVKNFFPKKKFSDEMVRIDPGSVFWRKR
jgi:hypothetical protein